MEKVALGAAILADEESRQKRRRKEEELETKNKEKSEKAKRDSENRRNEKIKRENEQKYDNDYDIVHKKFKNGEFLNNHNMLDMVLFHNGYNSSYEVKSDKARHEINITINSLNVEINKLFDELSRIYLSKHSNITKTGKITTPEEKLESMKKTIISELTVIFDNLKFNSVTDDTKEHIAEEILDKWRTTKGKTYFHDFTDEQKQLEENEVFVKNIIKHNGLMSNSFDSFGRHLHSSLIFHPSLLTFKQFKRLVDSANKHTDTLEDLFMPINDRNQRALGLNDYKSGRSDFKKISEIFQKFKNNKDFDKIVALMKKCETELGI